MSQIFRAVVTLEKKEIRGTYESNDSMATRTFDTTEFSVKVKVTKQNGDNKSEYWYKTPSEFEEGRRAVELVEMLNQAAGSSLFNFKGEVEFSVDILDAIDWTGGNSFSVPEDVLERIEKEAQVNPQLTAQIGNPILLEWRTAGSFNRSEFPEVILSGQRAHTYRFRLSDHVYFAKKRDICDTPAIEWTTPEVATKVVKEEEQSGFTYNPFAALKK